MPDELKHYGVKGMKWGVTRDEALLNRISGRGRLRASGGTRAERKALNKQESENWKQYKKTTSRSERKADRQKALEERGRYLIDRAMKQPMDLFQTRGSDGYPTWMSGKEFLSQVSQTGFMDVKYTELTGYRIGTSKPKKAA